MTELSTAIQSTLQSVIRGFIAEGCCDASIQSSVMITGKTVAISLESSCPIQSLSNAIATTLSQQFTDVTFSVTSQLHIKPHSIHSNISLLPNVKNIIVVASGKGGVGKSTVSTNLAVALQAEGVKVGLLDADIYGPSIPAMFDMEDDRPEPINGNTMQPPVRYGIQVASIGFLIDPKKAAIWRGAMVVQALSQLLTQTNWDDLDYLILDLPPGTGDIQLTLAQRFPITGAIIVTTPQKIALLDTQKSIAMFEKLSIPILGIVENMAIHTCNHCGHTSHIFGQHGGKALAEAIKSPLLASLPLSADICWNADKGTPVVLACPKSDIAVAYRRLAMRVGLLLSKRPIYTPPPSTDTGARIIKIHKV